MELYRLVAILVVMFCTLVCEVQRANLMISWFGMYYMYRRRRISLLQSLSGPIRRVRSRHAQDRTYWVRPGRTNIWWENFVKGVVIQREWKENFSMHQDTFFKLCSELRPFIERQKTNMCKPIDVEKQVAATLYYLSDEGRLRTSNSS